jgi:hypothetical protein
MPISLRHDENGIITEGKYTGQHVDDVGRYLEALEEARESNTTPPAKPKEEEETPEQRLARTNSNRNNDVVNLLSSTANRQEQDDEESFAASVDDYDEYRERIATMKKSMTPAQRVVRGVHKQMYLFIKVQSGEHASKLLGKGTPPPNADENEEIPETPPPAPIPEKKPVQTPPPTPKPAPPAARPTPGRTEPARASDKTALKPTARIERVAHGMGMKVEEYLKQLEARGVTQDDIDKGEVAPGGSSRRKTPYDYGTD